MSAVEFMRPSRGRRFQRVLSGKRLSVVVLLSVIFPPILIYFALCTKSGKQRHFLLTLLVGCFGLAIPITFDGTFDGSDAVRHLYVVHTYYTHLSWTGFWSDLRDIFALNGAPGSNDPYKHVISYFVASVIQVPELFFPIVALIYGYFFTGSMLIIFRNFDYRRLPYAVTFLALCLFLTFSFYSFQSVRNPTATVMLLYGVLMYHNTGRWKYLILIALTPMVHFSFLLIALPAFLYIVLGPRPFFYSAIFVSSFFIEAVTPSAVVGTINQYELGAEKIRDRSEEGRGDLSTSAERLAQQQSQGARGWRGYMMAGYHSHVLSLFIFSLIFSGIYFLMDRFSQAIFSNGLLFLSAGKFFWFLEGFTGRISTVGTLMILGAFVIWRTTKYYRASGIPFHFIYKYGLYATAFGLIPYFMFYLSIFLDWLVLFYFAFPFLAFVLPDANLPAKDLLRSILPI